MHLFLYSLNRLFLLGFKIPIKLTVLNLRQKVRKRKNAVILCIFRECRVIFIQTIYYCIL